MKKTLLLLVSFLIYFISFSQSPDNDKNQIVLYKINNPNKVSIISIGDKVKIDYSEPDKINFQKFRIKEIGKNSIKTDKGEIVTISKIQKIKDKTLGKANKGEGITIFLVGAAQAGAYYALDTYATNNGGTSIIKLFAGFGAAVASTYGIINWIVGVSKSNKFYVINTDWKLEVEQKKYFAPHVSPQIVK